MKFLSAGTGSAGNSYAIVSDRGEILLLEAGVSIQKIKRMIDFRVSDVVGCIISHSHQDHLLSADHLQNMGIKVVRAFDDEPLRMYAFGSFTVITFDLPHDGVENRGFLISIDGRKILYLTDYEYCKYKFTAQYIDTIIIECNYQDILVDMASENAYHIFKGHASLDTCLNFLKANQTDSLKNVILCHMSDRNADPEYCLAEVQKTVGESVGVSIATRGCEIEI